jgi:hypothetical protein
MKCFICYFDDGWDISPNGYEIDLTKKEIKRIDKIMNEYRKVQELLQKKFDSIENYEKNI